MYVCMYVCMYIYMYVCTNVCIYICLFAYIFYMYICMYLCMYAGTEKRPAETEIVDWSKVPSHIKVSELSEKEMVDYVLLLLARYIFGISDLADRNFLRKDGNIFSIDEEYRDRPVNFKNELKQNKCSIIKSWLLKNYDIKIQPKVEVWINIPEKLNIKYETVSDRISCLSLF